MTQEEINEIYERLLELTRSGALRWSRTSDDDYSVSFSRSTVSVTRGVFAGDLGVCLSIYNDDGTMEAKAFRGAIPDRSSEVKEFVLDPTDLLDLVRDRVLKYTETSTNILDELRQLDVRQRERVAR
jgi:hypothetical protein